MTHYQRLGVDRSASAAAIKSAYRAKVRDLHPDATGADPEKEEEFHRVVEAYEVLSDSNKRAQYDATLPNLVREQALHVVAHVAEEAIDGLAAAATETLNAKLGQGSRLGRKAAKAGGALLDVGREWCQAGVSQFIKKL